MVFAFFAIYGVVFLGFGVGFYAGDYLTHNLTPAFLAMGTTFTVTALFMILEDIRIAIIRRSK